MPTTAGNAARIGRRNSAFWASSNSKPSFYRPSPQMRPLSEMVMVKSFKSITPRLCSTPSGFAKIPVPEAICTTSLTLQTFGSGPAGAQTALASVRNVPARVQLGHVPEVVAPVAVVVNDHRDFAGDVEHARQCALTVRARPERHAAQRSAPDAQQMSAWCIECGTAFNFDTWLRNPDRDDPRHRGHE